MYLSRWAKFKFLRRVASYCTNISEFKKWPLTKKVPFESHRLKKKLNIKRFSTPRRNLNSVIESQHVKIFPMAIVKIPHNAQDLLVMPLNHNGFDASSSIKDNKTIFKDSLNLVVENTTDIMNIVQCLTMLDFKTNTIDLNEESVEVREIHKDKSIKNNINQQPKSKRVSENPPTTEKIDTINEFEDDHVIENKFKNFKAETKGNSNKNNIKVNSQNASYKVKAPSENIPKVETEGTENIGTDCFNQNIKTQSNILDALMEPVNISGTIASGNVQTQIINTEDSRPKPDIIQSDRITPIIRQHAESLKSNSETSSATSSTASSVTPLTISSTSTPEYSLSNTTVTSSLDIAKIASKELAKIAKSDQLAQNDVPAIRDMQLKLVLDLPDLKEIAKMKKENRPNHLLVKFNVHFNGVANLRFEDVEKALNNSNDVNQMSTGLASSICTLALRNFIAANNKRSEIQSKGEVIITDCKVKDTQYSIAIKNNSSDLPAETPK